MIFPKDLYTDVRFETVYNSVISYENGKLKQNKTTLEKGAFIRVFDGSRWYYCATTDLDNVQCEIEQLAELATPNPSIFEHPVVRKLEVNRDVCLRFRDNSVADVDNSEKVACLSSYLPLMDELEDVQTYRISYYDQHTEKHILSSLGTDVTFDYQHALIHFFYSFGCDGVPFQNIQTEYRQSFPELHNLQQAFREKLSRDWNYAHNAVAVEPGLYTCVLSPMVAGVFAHESFGHKSESDFMIGDETMKREWALGTRVGSEILSIVDSGLPAGSGYVPYDDEGCRAKETFLIRNGILSGRLHSAHTAASLDEAPTGNARGSLFDLLGKDYLGRSEDRPFSGYPWLAVNAEVSL